MYRSGLKAARLNLDIKNIFLDIHKTESFGMELVTDLVIQLKGTIKIKFEKK